MTRPEAAPMRKDVTASLVEVRSHKYTCANVQIGSTVEDRCDCGALDSAGKAIPIARLAHTTRHDAAPNLNSYIDGYEDAQEVAARPDTGDEVERVARAIYETDDVWNVAWPWPDLDPQAQGGQNAVERYREIARAAIAAMREGVDRGMVLVPREPTEAMREAGLIPLSDNLCGLNAIWTAMVDAAALSRKRGEQ